MNTVMFDEENLKQIRESREEWEAQTLDPWLERGGERQDEFVTSSNHEIDRMYAPEDIADIDYEGDLVMPVEPPYTRGPQT